jgi:CheY-like chemotaxis protein
VSHRILVVDDIRDCADALAHLLIVMGYEAKAVYSGQDAIEQAAIFLPDLAFIDIGMPGLNGYETVARIRQERDSIHLILVALTGWTNPDDKQRAYTAGFDMHVGKPMSDEKLREVLSLLNPTEGK